MKRSDFRISGGAKHYAYIKGTDDYLFKPGIVFSWAKALTKWGDNLVDSLREVNKKVYFSSREELEECLDKYLEEQNMSEKMIKIKGKEVSESTIVEALKKHINFKTTVPIISSAKTKFDEDRMVINLTPKMLSLIERGFTKQIIIDADGNVPGWNDSYVLTGYYNNQEPIFGEIENGE